MAESKNPKIAAAQRLVDAKRREVQKAQHEGRTRDEIRLAAEWQRLVNDRERIAAEEADKDVRHNRKSK